MYRNKVIYQVYCKTGKTRVFNVLQSLKAEQGRDKQKG